MPKYNVTIGAAQYEVDAPDENTAWKWANATHYPKQEAAAPEESELFKAGRTMPTWAQGALKLGDVLSSGLAKRMAGPQTSEMVRGATTQFGEKNPALSFGAEIAGTVPQMFIAPETALGRTVPMWAQGIRAAGTGAVQGGLTGLGQSQGQTAEENLKDALTGAAFGAATAPTGLAAGKILGMAGPATRRVGAAVGATQFGSITPAQRQLALALSRDVPEGFTGTPGEFALSQIRQLGPEGRIADVGESTRKLADLMASLPGRAPKQFKEAIELRQGGRGERLMQAGEETLEKPKVGFSQTIKSLEEQKLVDSQPFYDALKNVTVPVDDELVSILQSAGKEALRKSNRLSRLAGKDQISLKEVSDARDTITNAIIPGKQLSFDSLDKVKQSLYDLESKFADSGQMAESAAFGNLRRRLTAKLDALSPKDNAGVSIYSKARDAFAGPAQLRDAVKLGREAFTKDAVEMQDLVNQMSSGEKDAFQIGAIQALRDKTGVEAGQTSLLKYWKESKTSDALKRIFGDKYENFENALKREKQLKEFETIGRGSQTFGREAAAEDQGAQMLLEGAEAATRAATQPWSLISTIQRGSSRLQMPENVRNQLARLLLQQGGSAEQELMLLDKAMSNLARKRARSAGLAGALGGTAGAKISSELEK